MWRESVLWHLYVRRLPGQSKRVIARDNEVHTILYLISSDVKLIAFKCLILPTLEYASPVWEPFTNQNIYKLERIQNKAARFIFNCYRSTESVTKLKEQAGLPSIKTRLETNRMKLFFQIFHGHSMLDTRKYVVMSPPVYHRIKHSLNIQSYQYSTDHFKHSFFVRCIDFWNKLPECIVNSQSVSTFVKEIEMFLSSHVTKGCDWIIEFFVCPWYVFENMYHSCLGLTAGRMNK